MSTAVDPLATPFGREPDATRGTGYAGSDPLAFMRPKASTAPDISADTARVNAALSILGSALLAAQMTKSTLDIEVEQDIALLKLQGTADGPLLLQSQPALLGAFLASRAVDGIPSYETTLSNWLVNRASFLTLVQAGKLHVAPAFPAPPASVSNYLPGVTF